MGENAAKVLGMFLEYSPLRVYHVGQQRLKRFLSLFIGFVGNNLCEESQPKIRTKRQIRKERLNLKYFV